MITWKQRAAFFRVCLGTNQTELNPKRFALLHVHGLNRSKLDCIISHAEIVEQDSHGIKVLRLNDGRYLKYFRRKRYFGSELLSPAAVRFARNARRLEKLNIPTLRIESLHHITDEKDTVAIYQPLEGHTLRHLLANKLVSPELAYRLGVFLARLHRQGVFFRSVHPGNIVIDGLKIGLIDLLDMRTKPWSMSRWSRRRNWKHLFRTPEDRPHWSPELIDSLLHGYYDSADLPAREVKLVAQRVHELI